jgi:hypothetical protein
MLPYLHPQSSLLFTGSNHHFVHGANQGMDGCREEMLPAIN